MLFLKLLDKILKVPKKKHFFCFNVWFELKMPSSSNLDA